MPSAALVARRQALGWRNSVGFSERSVVAHQKGPRGDDEHVPVQFYDTINK